MGIIRDSFVVFKNWADAINAMPEEYQLETYILSIDFLRHLRNFQKQKI